MAVNPRRARFPALITVIMVFVIGSFSCTSRHDRGGTEGVFVSTALPLASYVQAGSRRGAGKGTEFFFPQLEIYDESGDLIYTSHEAIENAHVLGELSAGVRSFGPKPKPARLSEILKELPDFLARKEEILGPHRVSVLSVFLEDCHACSVPEDALDSAKHQLLDHGINLLVVRVSRR
jgi:hypothetical protein